MKKFSDIFKTKAFKIVTAVLLAAAIFMAGFFTMYLTLDKSVRSVIWIKDQIDSYYYTDISDEEFLEALTDGLDGILDDYSTYYTADEYADYKSSYAGNNTGVGLSFTLTYGAPRIYRVSGNSPAEKAGVKEGAFVVGVGDDEENITYTTTYSEIAAYINAKASYTDFCLAVSDKTEGGNIEYYTIQKQEYNENYVFYRSSSTAYRFEGSSATELTAYDGAIEGLASDTAYIRLNRFAGNAGKQIKAALDVFKSEGKKNLVLDLRGNGGGDLDVLSDIASYFMKGAEGSSPIVATAEYKSGSTATFRADGNYYGDYFSSDSKITVLANRNTASASECLMGAMIEYNTIDYDDIILSDITDVSSTDGRPSARTYGKGIMQTTYTNIALGGEAIKLTVATVHWPVTGKCIHGVGVTAEDGARSVKTPDYTTYGDEELKEIVKNYLK